MGIDGQHWSHLWKCGDASKKKKIACIKCNWDTKIIPPVQFLLCCISFYVLPRKSKLMQLLVVNQSAHYHCKHLPHSTCSIIMYLPWTRYWKLAVELPQRNHNWTKLHRCKHDKSSKVQGFFKKVLVLEICSGGVKVPSIEQHVGLICMDIH